ncbi:MAG TPA: hypothetical protein VFB22_15720 [Candidatus Baltobacteraceae bacterium]|nr:hypothetical protein [Candidatus Baltobacteraceae bacterium]
MRLPATASVLASLALFLGPLAAGADQGDILIQAGHQGRPQSCAPLHVRACNLGTSGGGALEREWTPIVADEAARVLRDAGYTVLRRPADYAGRDVARAAVFLHFDGSAKACGSGASVGFPPSTNRTFVDAWETQYRALFPYRFVGENFTRNESEYYGFRKVDAPDKLLIEFGEMTCPEQLAWMRPRLRELGDRLARFLMQQVPLQQPG